jgi:nicotinamide riboside transporter PnuC
MNPDKPAKKEWVFYGRWALIPAVVGISIVAFVIVTEGAYATWTLWIAIPMIMIGLGYIFIVNAIASLISVGQSDDQSEGEE